MGQAQSVDNSPRRKSKKPVVKKGKKAAPPPPEPKGKKGGKKGKKSKRPPTPEESEEDFSDVEMNSDAGSGSEAESEGPSECPSSFLGDDSDGGAGDDDEDSGHATMVGKPITFQDGMFCAFGVHSVDISVTVGKAYLERYQLIPGQKVDFDQTQHKDLIDEVKSWFPFEHRPSGAALLTSRIVNWIVREPLAKVVTVGGTVGADGNGTLIESNLEEFGLQPLLKKNSIASTAASISLSSSGAESHPTVVTKNSVAGSAFKLLDYNETDTPSYLSKAKIIYLTGYFVASSPEASLEICRYAAEKGKIVALSLSATYICQFHKSTILQLLQYVDYLFANEDQLLTFAREHSMKDTDNVESCSQQIARLPKINSSRRRIVLTQNGETSCLVAQGYNKIRLFMGTDQEKTPSLDGSGIFDAFVGGFLSQILQGMPLEEAIEIGYRSCSSMIGVAANTVPRDICSFGKVEPEEDDIDEDEDGEEDDDEEGEEEDDEEEEGSDEDDDDEDDEDEDGSEDEGSDEEEEDEEDEDGSDDDEEEEDEDEEDEESEEEDEDDEDEEDEEESSSDSD